MWILLSATGALFQSVTGAINKRNLDVSRSSVSLVAFINYFFGSVVLVVFALWQTGHFIPQINFGANFWYGILIASSTTVIGAYFGYRALNLAEFNYISPWLTLTSLIVVVPSFLLLREIPSSPAVVGIIIIVFGALLIDYKKKHVSMSADEELIHARNRKAKSYLIIIGIAYSISPVGMKMATLESSPIFVVVVVQLAVALSFLFAIFAYERKKIVSTIINLSARDKKIFFATALTAGVGYAISNGTVNTALTMANVSSVMAIKRIAPVFSFFIGYFFLREKRNARRKLIATILMVAGTILITIFK